jgi:Ca2+-binding RTX toxin-like protein
MDGGPGNDELHGGPGDDALVGDEGNDTYFGDAGDDFIYAHVGESPKGKDTIHCGDGVDEVTANRNDVVDADCEVVHRVPNPKKHKKAEQKRSP